MRYTCTIYTTDRSLATKTTTGGGDGDPAGDGVLGQVLVSGASKREAAARAYVECVGRERARKMREELQMPRKIAKQHANAKAIAASLRKVNRSGGECFLLDEYVEGWVIHVEPVVDLPRLQSTRRLRLPYHCLLHLSRTPSIN